MAPPAGGPGVSLEIATDVKIHKIRDTVAIQFEQLGANFPWKGVNGGDRLS